MAIMEQTTNVDQDDEEWYPPSPPIYDVAGKTGGKQGYPYVKLVDSYIK